MSEIDSKRARKDDDAEEQDELVVCVKQNILKAKRMELEEEENEKRTVAAIVASFPAPPLIGSDVDELVEHIENCLRTDISTNPNARLRLVHESSFVMPDNVMARWKQAMNDWMHNIGRTGSAANVFASAIGKACAEIIDAGIVSACDVIENAWLKKHPITDARPWYPFPCVWIGRGPSWDNKTQTPRSRDRILNISCSSRYAL